MSKEITITNANNFHSFISFQINGLEDGITVGIVSDPNSHGQALSIAYKGEVKIVPLNAISNDIEYLNKDEVPAEVIEKETKKKDKSEKILFEKCRKYGQKSMFLNTP